MTIAVRPWLRQLVAGSALAIASLACVTVVFPAIGQADTTTPNCSNDKVLDDETNECVPLVDSITKQLQALPPPPALAGNFGSLPGGIPALGTINAPDLVLPGFGVGLVPNINLQPQIGLPPPPDLTKLPTFNPLNPLGLPPPPDLTPGIPFI